MEAEFERVKLEQPEWIQTIIGIQDKASKNLSKNL